MKSVRFDIQIFQGRAHGGIGTYFNELRSAIESIPDVDWKVRQDGFLHLNNELKFDRKLHLNYRNSKLRHVANIVNSKYMAIRDSDITHSTYYRSEFLWQCTKKPHVITIHDMIPEDYADYFRTFSPSLAKREYLLNSQAIICVSEYTRKRLLTHYGEIQTPIHVIHHSSRFRIKESDIESKISQLGRIGTKRLLFVGAREGYKRFDILLEAMAMLLKSKLDIELVCVGGGAFSIQEVAWIEKYQLPIYQIDASNSELYEIYLTSDLYICTSESEGFGLPALEAMAMKCPVLVSDIEVFSEICGQNVSKFVAGNSEDLALQIKNLILNPEQRAEKAESGYNRSQEFSWNKAAQKTLDVYSGVLNG